MSAADAITARALARRIARGQAPVVVVDVRDHADFAAWRIVAPGVRLEVRNLPPDTALRRVEALAGTLPGGADVVVTGYAGGEIGVAVAAALRERGIAACVLDGGMAAWGRLLRPVRVRLSLPGVRVVQVQRVGRGCLSYLVVSGAEAMVVDPGSDVSGYGALAERHGSAICGVMDTHLHGDHISGARALARLTGAELLLPEATLRRGVAFAGEASAVQDGEVLRVGDARMQVVALPGHTPDMTALLLCDHVLLSGDSLLAAGVARPEASGDEALELARTLHDALHERVLGRLGPRTRLLPGHYPGGVRRAPVAPTLSEARAAAPEVDLPREAFARRLVAAGGADLARARRIGAVNAGRSEGDTALEAGAGGLVHSP